MLLLAPVFLAAVSAYTYTDIASLIGPRIATALLVMVSLVAIASVTALAVLAI